MHISLIPLFSFFLFVSSLTPRIPESDSSSCPTSTNSDGDQLLDCPGGCQQVTNTEGKIKLQQGTNCGQYFGPKPIGNYADGAVIQAPDCHITVSGGKAQKQGSSCDNIQPYDSKSENGGDTKSSAPATTTVPTQVQTQPTPATSSIQTIETTTPDGGALAISNATALGDSHASSNATGIGRNATAIAIARSADGNVTAFAIATAYIDNQCNCVSQANDAGNMLSGSTPAALPQSDAKRAVRRHAKREAFYDEDDAICSSCQALRYEHGGLMLTCPGCKLNIGKDLKPKLAQGQCSKYTSCLARSAMALAVSGDHFNEDPRCSQTELPDGRTFRVCPGCTSGMNKEGKIVGLAGERCNQYLTSASLEGSAEMPLWETWSSSEVSKVGAMACTQIYSRDGQTVVACPGCTKTVDWDGTSVEAGPSCQIYDSSEVQKSLSIQGAGW